MKYLLCFLLMFFSFFRVLHAQSTDYVKSFDSQIVINQNTSLSITETIQYFTSIEKHGIYRYIPTRYRRDNQIYTTTISNLQISGAKFTTYHESNNLVIKIGDPEITFSGDKTYVIKYEIDNALTGFPDHDELYWDITGDGWQIPVLKTTATINSSFATVTESICYSGVVGTNNQKCSLTQTNPVALNYPESVNYGDNVTVALKLLKPNQLHFLTPTEKLLKSIKDNLVLFLIPVPALILFLMWYRWGRDYEFISPNVFNLDPNQPKRLKPLFEPAKTAFIYEPLKNLSPAEAGALLDEKVDSQDIISDIIDLAHLKYLKIDLEEKRGFLSSSTDYLFTKLKDSDPLLHKSQQQLMAGIFRAKDGVLLSDLKSTFFTTMETVRSTINETLTKERLYTQNPNQSRGIGFATAIALNILIFIVSIQTISFLGAAWPYILFGIQGIISLFYANNLVQKTAVGNNLMLQAKGLKETISLGKWREEVKEKHLFIEEVLPYAVAFGVVGKLAADMKDLGLEPPQYFQSAGFTGGNWTGLVSGFSASAASTMSYNPSSSKWSSSSGFSGGSSGGGGGGGGGGSW